MASKSSLPDNISHASLNDARKELDEKLNKVRVELDGKIGEKISNTVFFSILTIVVIILVAVFGYFCVQISSLKDDTKDLNTRITILETKSQPRYRSIPQQTIPSTNTTTISK